MIAGGRDEICCMQNGGTSSGNTKSGNGDCQGRTLLENGVTVTAIRGQIGIWFFVRFPSTWDLRVFTEEDARWPNGPTHPSCWPILADELAQSWAAERGELPANLRAQIEDSPYAFPRGRISRSDNGQLCCFFGEESLIDAKTKKRIENLFAGGESLQWRQDEHEHCLVFDRDDVCAALGLEATWDAM